MTAKPRRKREPEPIVDGGPLDYWRMEHSQCGGSPWIRIRARGLHWINVTPAEALDIADRIIERYRTDDRRV